MPRQGRGKKGPNLANVLKSRTFQRFWSVAGAVSIRTKVLGIVLATLFLLSIFVTIQVRRSLGDILRDQLEHQGLSITTHVAAAAANLVRAGDVDSLNVLLREAQDHYSDERHNTQIEYLFITVGGEEVLAHTFPDAVPEDVLHANRLGPGAETTETWYSAGGGHVLDIAERISAGTDPVGTVRLGLSDRDIRAAVNRVTRQLVLTSVLMSFSGIAAAVFLTWIITRPIRNLVAATQAVTRGDFSQRVHPWANDEIGRLAESFNAMTAALARADQEQAGREKLRAEFVSRVIAAQEDERRRIARELHDSTSQSLTSLLIGLQAIDQAIPADIRPRTGELRQIVSETLNEVHGLAWQLRPSVLDDLGLRAALEHYIADFQERYHTPVDLTIHGQEEQRLSPETETTIYRIVQEALTNVARHAHAQRASVTIELRRTKTRIIIEDNGIGLDPAAITKESRQHLGLWGIRERAELLGGKLTIEAEPGRGTSLFVELPGTDRGENGRS